MKRSGFTLAELLATMAIISVLVALGFPALGRMRDNAKRAQTTNNLRQIATGLSVYAADVGNYPLEGNNPPTGTGDAQGQATSKDYWTTMLIPYLDRPSSNPAVKNPVFNDPWVAAADHHTISDYGINARVVRDPKEGAPLPASSVVKPSQTVLVVPAVSTTSGKATWYIQRLYDTQDGTDAKGNGDNKPSDRGNPNFILTGFADGHVGIIPVTDLNASIDKQKYFRPNP